jgi:uncharacterized surface protein with fasciclin (FAS1) repeats
MDKSKSGMIAGGLVVLTLVIGGIFWAMSGDDSNNQQNNKPETSETSRTQEQAVEAKNIVEVASGNEDFSTLVTAIKAAGLVETLSGEGQFTVFAPTNAAFAKLPADTLDQLLANPTELSKVLTYHVVPGKVTADQVVGLTEATTAQGQKVSIKVENGVVMINNSKVTSTDIAASNGVIHVIDTVLLPQ